MDNIQNQVDDFVQSPTEKVEYIAKQKTEEIMKE